MRGGPEGERDEGYPRGGVRVARAWTGERHDPRAGDKGSCVDERGGLGGGG